MAQAQAGRGSPRKLSTVEWIDARRREIEALEAAARRAYLQGAQRVEEQKRAISAAVDAKLDKVADSAVRARQGVAEVIRDPRSKASQQFLRNAKNQTVAATHGAGDALTFGAADHVSAGIRAALETGTDLSRIGKLYKQNMEQERAQDAYEAENYGAARMGGQVLGTVGSMIIPGAVVGRAAQAARAVPALRPLIMAGQRIPQATKMVGSEYIALGGLGAAGGLASEALSDAAHGSSSSGDYLGAAMGGAAASLGATRLGPVANGMIGGAVGSAAQDVLSGRRVSLADASLAGAIGAGAGSAGGLLAVNKYRSMPNLRNGKYYSKGELGEDLSRIRSWARLDPMTDPTEAYIEHPGRRAKQDYATRQKIVEAKIGPTAKLSPGQLDAAKYLGAGYQVDHIIERDLANLGGLPLAELLGGLLDPQAVEERRRRLSR